MTTSLDAKERPRRRRRVGSGATGALRALQWTLVAVGGVSLVGVAVTSVNSLGFALVWLGYLVVGLLVLRRRPHHRLGWLMLVTGTLALPLVWLLSAVSFAPGAGPPALESVVRSLTVWPFLGVCAIVTLFPDGRATTPLDRALIRIMTWGGLVLSVTLLLGPSTLDSGRINPLAAPALASLGLVFGSGFLIIPLLLVVSLVGVVRKWNRSTGAVHHQYTCLLFGAAIAAAAFVLAFVTDGSIVGSVSWVVSLAALPVGMGVAILRFRLFDIDRIVRRTTSYAIVTGLLLCTYVIVVTAVTRLLPDSGSLAVAGATLAAAALARPLLRRVQNGIDRRFNRARYDARQTIDSFGEALRHEIDGAALNAQLVATVHATLQPSELRLWVREPW